MEKNWTKNTLGSCPVDNAKKPLGLSNAQWHAVNLATKNHPTDSAFRGASCGKEGRRGTQKLRYSNQSSRSKNACNPATKFHDAHASDFEGPQRYTSIPAREWDASRKQSHGRNLATGKKLPKRVVRSLKAQPMVGMHS